MIGLRSHHGLEDSTGAAYVAERWLELRTLLKQDQETPPSMCQILFVVAEQYWATMIRIACLVVVTVRGIPCPHVHEHPDLFGKKNL